MAALPWQGQHINEDGVTDQDRGWGVCVSHKDDHPIPPTGWSWATHSQDDRRVTLLWDPTRFNECLPTDKGAIKAHHNASFGFWVMPV